MLDLFLERLEGIEENRRTGARFFGEDAFPARLHLVGNLRQVGRTHRDQRVLELMQELAYATRLDRLDLETIEPLFEPVDEVQELLPFHRRRSS